MTRTVIRGAQAVVTMDEGDRELAGACIVIEGGTIAAIGAGGDLREPIARADAVIDAAGCIVTPGLVNTHHHLFQSLTRAVPGAADAPLFGWLQRLYPIWQRLRPEDVRAAVRLGLAELALSGCTTSSDHHYLFPDGVRLDDTIEAAATVGLRFHATRGSMSVGESQGGLPPDSAVEDEDAILADTIRVIDAFHDPAPGAMVRIGVAPCSPFSVSRELMRQSALLARDKKVMLHTHLAEDEADVAYSLARFGCRPGEYAQGLGWVGEDVWHAHAVRLDPSEIALFARTRTGVAHCPCSNCRLGSGIAPVAAMLAAGVPVGLGVDGSASNDAADLLAEARAAMLLQRVANGAGAMSARAALGLATRGGARVLGRDDVGVLAPGMRADIAIWDVSGPRSTGAWDPVAGLLLAPPAGVRDLFVEGRAVVRDGRLASADQDAIAREARASLARLMEDA